MLILTRKPGERLILGDDIFITIIDVGGNQVKVGITAPSNISIHREEIYKLVQKEKENATNIASI